MLHDRRCGIILIPPICLCKKPRSSHAHQTPAQPVPFTDVHFDDVFWAPRIETNRKVTLPHIYRMLEETGRIGAFDLNFEREVPSHITLIFGDSDPAKWIEAASYSLATHPDPELEAMVDYVVGQDRRAPSSPTATSTPTSSTSSPRCAGRTCATGTRCTAPAT